MATEFTKIATQISPSDFLSYRDYLRALYEHLKGKILGYSYYRMAKDLGFSQSGIVHQFISGRRPLTVKTGRRMASKIGLRGDQRSYFLAMIEYNGGKTNPTREAGLAAMVGIKSRLAPGDLKGAQVDLSQEWYYTVVRELVALPYFQNDPVWIASQVIPKIKPLQAKKSLEVLDQLGLVKMEPESGKLVQTSQSLQTAREVSNHGVAKFHHEAITLASAALSTIEQERRDVSSVTLRVSERTFAEIKQKVYTFLREILEKEASPDETKAIYQLNIQFFPVTKDIGSPKTEDDHE